MNNDQIRTLVVPRLFERIGKEIVNKRNGIGRAFNLEKLKPITSNVLKQIDETFKLLQSNDQFKIDQYITIIENHFSYKDIKSFIEQALESNDEEVIVESMKKTSSNIIRHLKRL